MSCVSDRVQVVLVYHRDPFEAIRDVLHYLFMGADTNCSGMRSPGQNSAKFISISPLKAGHLKHEQSEGRLYHAAPRSQEIKPPLASVKQFLLEEKHGDRATLILNSFPVPQ